MEQKRFTSYEKLYNILHNKFIGQQQTIAEINIEIKQINEQFESYTELTNIYWKLLGHPLYGKLIPVSFPTDIYKNIYYYTSDGIIYYENDNTIPVDPYVMYFTYFYKKREMDDNEQARLNAQKEEESQRLQSQKIQQQEQKDIQEQVKLESDKQKLNEEAALRSQLQKEQNELNTLRTKIQQEQELQSQLREASTVNDKQDGLNEEQVKNMDMDIDMENKNEEQVKIMDMDMDNKNEEQVKIMDMDMDNKNEEQVKNMDMDPNMKNKNETQVKNMDMDMDRTLKIRKLMIKF